MLTALMVAMVVCAVGPAAVFCVNLRRYREPEALGVLALPAISVLIPARDEEGGIETAVASVLTSVGVEFEVVVMDDCSTDRTSAIVTAMAERDGRVRLEQAPALPAGWNGKQHACWALAHVAKHDVMCFVDADVRLEPEALARMVGFLGRGGNGLVSGFPQQVTGTWLERLLLPLIHFVLLGFLPLGRMRGGTDPAFAAGCGQFLMVRREDYFACGGHVEIKETMHDGLLLPRLFRAHGYRTDLADITALATCRMYTNARQVWFGLAKNATEGIADPARIGPITVVLMLGQVVPFLMLAWLCLDLFLLTFFGSLVRVTNPHRQAALLAVILFSAGAAWLPRVLAVGRFKQSVRGAVLHPVGIVVLLVVQWYALGRKLMGGAVSWKSRAYAGE